MAAEIEALRHIDGQLSALFVKKRMLMIELILSIAMIIIEPYEYREMRVMMMEMSWRGLTMKTVEKAIIDVTAKRK